MQQISVGQKSMQVSCHFIHNIIREICSVKENIGQLDMTNEKYAYK